MDKKYYLFSIDGKDGYSFIVHSNAKDEEEAIDQAYYNSLFHDDEDARYCNCEEARQYDIDRFNKFGAIIEL